MKRALGAAAAASLLAALIPTTSAVAASPVITVDLGASTGAVTKGAAGFLYGLADDGIPSDNTIVPLHPSTTYQKAPDGAQHPNGDALATAPQWVRDGGGDIGIYMQDYLKNFPYDNPGIAAYTTVVQDQARKVIASPYRSRIIYVPFNEPDGAGQWYQGDLSGLERDWKTIYQAIRQIDSTARIAGPNYSDYNKSDYYNFLKFTRDNNVLPDVTTWHELNNDTYSSWYDHFNSYRTSEASLGISPRPISINEYARPEGDLGVPGNLVQLMTRFENSKVSANLAFWNDSGSLDDLVANFESNKVDGGWWLYKWYGELTGNTVAVTPPSQNGSLQALATYDANKKQSRILLGGAPGANDVFSTDVQVNRVPSALGSSVHATVWGVDNTGFSASSGPYVLTETDATVANGSLSLTLNNLKASSAYQVILTPNTDTTAASTSRYEAEYADLSGSARVTYGSNNGYSGTYFTEGYGGSNNASTNFVVNAPSDGYYSIGLRYSAGPFSGAPTDRVARLSLNGAIAKDLTLPGTSNWNTWNTVTARLYLRGGINRIGVSAFTNDDSDAINVDYIDVTPTTGTVNTIEAENSANQLTGSTTRASNSSASGGSYVGNIGNGSGNTLTFSNVQVPTAGTYALVVQYANSEYLARGGGNPNSVNRFANISVNGGAVQKQYFRVTGSWSTFRTTMLTVTLKAGTNTIAFSNPTAYAPDIDRISVASVVG